MHEFSICRLLLKALQQEYDQLDPAPVGLKSVTVMIGEMHQIVPDYLLGAYQALTADTAFAASELKLEFTPTTGSCPSCLWTGTIQPPLFVCPDCQKPGIDVQTGKELYICKLEVNF